MLITSSGFLFLLLFIIISIMHHDGGMAPGMSKDWEQLAQGLLAAGSQPRSVRLGPWLAALGPAVTTSWPAWPWPAEPWSGAASASTIRLEGRSAGFYFSLAGLPVLSRVHNSPVVL
jgi:hypothetical protein